MKNNGKAQGRPRRFRCQAILSVALIGLLVASTLSTPHLSVVVTKYVWADPSPSSFWANISRSISSNARPASSSRSIRSNATPARSNRSIRSNATPARSSRSISSNATPTSSNRSIRSNATPASSSSITHSENYQNDLYGYPNIEFFPLQDWEIQSMNGTHRKCQPPQGVSSFCCVGAISTGGVSAWKSTQCLRADHKASEIWTQEYLQRLPFQVGRPCDICEIVKIMAHFNWTVAMQGDSLVHQSWVGLECELARRGFSITTHQEKFASGGQADLQSIFTMTVNVSSSNSITFRYYRGYRPGKYMLNRSMTENDILVFDHGLHYPPNKAQEDLKKDMARILETFRDQDHDLKLVAWRETSAQHFGGKPGGYFLRHPNGFTGNCTPMHENFTEAANHNAGLPLSQEFLDTISQAYPFTHYRNITDETPNVTWLDVSNTSFLNTPPDSGTTELVYLPYRDYTKMLYYMHDKECTHYCANPFIWHPIWRGLRLAMQRTAKYQHLANGRLQYFSS